MQHKPLKVRTVKIINCFDLDELVQEVYGRPYCFQQQDDCRHRGYVHVYVPSELEYCEDFALDEIPEQINGSVMGVSFKAWLEADPNGPFANSSSNCTFWERNFYPHIDQILHDLFKKGLIDLGDYKIEIDW